MKKIVLITLCLITFWNYSQTFTLKSKILSGQATEKQVFNGFGCMGLNISPDLYWENPPKETKSFAITMYDPDAPTGSGWWHWLVFDIPNSTPSLVENAGNSDKNLLPKGVIQSVTDFGKVWLRRTLSTTRTRISYLHYYHSRFESR
jgi:phosphatidylethanolamine-binding protein (PEBP) family uncharacterized protein